MSIMYQGALLASVVMKSYCKIIEKILLVLLKKKGSIQQSM